MVLGAVLLVAVAAGTARAEPNFDADRVLERVQHVLEGAFDRIVSVFDRGDHGDERDAREVRVARSAQSNDFVWTGTLDAGDVIQIRGVNGKIVAAAASGDEVEVVAIKRARRSDPDEVRIEVVEHAGGVTVCAVYPTPRGKRENRCGPGDDFRMNTERNDVQVDFEVRVPAGVEFEGRTVNGDIEALDLEADARVSTVNGDIEVTTNGFAEATTVNGSIRASMGSTPFAEGVTFSTVNGSIVLDLPDDIDAELDASWVNGSLETDLPFRLQGRVSRTSARGVLGDGGPELTLNTVNGSIRIR